MPADLLAAARACARVCEAHGTNLPTAALQFPLRHPAISSVVVGMRSERDCALDVASLKAPIDQQLWNELPDAVR